MSVAASTSAGSSEKRPLSIKRQFAWSVVPLLVVTVVNFISVRLFFRYLGDEMYALLGYVMTFTGMFGFADLGLGVAVGRYIGVALGKDDLSAVREYWGTGNLIALPLVGMMAIAFAAIGVSLGPVWFNVAPENENMLRECFVFGAFALFFNYYGQFWLILSQAHLHFKFIGILRTGTILIQIIPSIMLAWLTKNPLWIIVWSATTSLVQLLVFMRHSQKYFDLGIELAFARRARAREMASYTAKTFASLLLGSLFGSVDKLFLGKLATPTDFTNYTNGAANVGMRIQALSTGIMGPVFSNTARAVGNGPPRRAAVIYNETFNFVFGWYVFVAVWVAVWHPVLLRLWLGGARGSQVSPLFTPIIVAFCLTAISNISAAQLGALNRMGTSLGFTIAAGILAVGGVYIGWRMTGVTGVAYGFLFSRIALFAQDCFTIKLIKAGGWFDPRTWIQVAWQIMLGLVFFCAYFVFPSRSVWLVIPAALHGCIVCAWLARHHLQRLIWNRERFEVTQI